MKITKLFLTVSGIFMLCSTLFALEVNKQELTTVTEEEIVFENYTGPHSVINTAEQIAGIGKALGKEIVKDVESYSKAGSAARYQVIHAIDPNESGKLDADILIIGPNSTIDHIKNVRRVIAAYLSTTYGYSEDDAKTVATFITVYNAVYKGKLDYFQNKYKKVVTDNLSADKCGIALSYRQWPGNTQLVIPLNDIKGGLSTVDTSVISDKQVVKSMQGEDDKGVDSRKEMVDIKEREADNAQEKASSAQKKATEENAKLKEEQQKSAEADKKAEETKKEAEEAKKAAAENPDDEQAQKDAAEAQKKAEQAQTDADNQKKAVEEQAQKTEEAKEKAASEQAVADTKRSEAQSERTSIAQDQQTLIKEKAANDGAATVFGLKAVDETGLLCALVKINAETGKVIKESPVSVIRGRTIYDAGDNYLAIAGSTEGNGAVKLVLLDKNNMEISKESAEIVSENSVLIEKDGTYFCVIKEGDNWIVGKFDNQVQNVLKSPVTVKPATPITINDNGVLVTTSDNKPVLLNTKDLNLISNQ